MQAGTLVGVGAGGGAVSRAAEVHAGPEKLEEQSEPIQQGPMEGLLLAFHCQIRQDESHAQALMHASSVLAPLCDRPLHSVPEMLWMKPLLLHVWDQEGLGCGVDRVYL